MIFGMMEYWNNGMMGSKILNIKSNRFIPT